MWCCKTTKDQCIKEEIYPHNVICNGTALSLSDQCHDENYNGQSCNYYPMDEYRNGGVGVDVSRSYLDLCQDNRYVQHYKEGFTNKSVTYVQQFVLFLVLVLMKHCCARGFHYVKTKMI